MATTYNARIELDTRADIDDDLLDALAPYHPATARTDTGRVEVILTLPAEGFAQLAQTAVSIVETALAEKHFALLLTAKGSPVQALELMPTDEYDRRAGLTPVPDLISVTEAAAALGVTRQAILQRLEAGTLPGRKIGNAWVIPRGTVVGGDAPAA